MRARNGFALLSALAFGLAACGGGDTETDEMEMGEMPEAEQPAPATGGAGSAMVPDSLPEGVTAEMVTEGQTVFTSAGLCFSCHGQDGTGTQLAPDLTDDEWLNVQNGDYQEIIQVVRTGVQNPVEHASPMPPMGGAQLSDQQVESVAAYVWTLSHGNGGM